MLSWFKAPTDAEDPVLGTMSYRKGSWRDRGDRAVLTASAST